MRARFLRGATIRALDVGTLIVAVIGALGGGAATAAGGMYRNRVAVKSAARLIHAELMENSALFATSERSECGRHTPRSDMRLGTSTE